MAKFGDLIDVEGPVLLEFFTEWDEGSTTMHPVLKDVAAALGDKAKVSGIALASHLRDEAIIAVIAPAGRSLKAQMRYAGALNARYTIIIGQEELEKGVVLVRDMDQAQQQEVASGDLIDALKP